MTKIVAVASGKGGVGKTTLSVGLGLSFASMGKQTLLIELDAGLRGIDLMLGISDQIVYDLGDLIESRCDINQVLNVCPFSENLNVIAAPAFPVPISIDDLLLLIGGLCGRFDVIILDLPAGLELSLSLIPKLGGLDPAGALSAGRPSVTALIVATPDPVSVRSGRGLVEGLRRQHFDRHRLVINRISERRLKKQGMRDLDEVIDGVGSQLIGALLEDELLTLSAIKGEPLPQSSFTARVFSAIARRLDDAYIPLLIR